MMKVNDCSMIFQTNFNRYNAELVRTRSAPLRSFVAGFARLGFLRVGACAPTPRPALRSASGSAFFQNAFAVLVATYQLRKYRSYSQLSPLRSANCQYLSICKIVSLPRSVVPPSLITATKQNTLRSAPCFLFVFPLLGRLIFVASQPIVFRLII